LLKTSWLSLIVFDPKKRLVNNGMSADTERLVTIFIIPLLISLLDKT